MTNQTAYQHIILSNLLEQLRAHGIAVGARELQHLQTVFEQSPDLSRDELKQLLCHLLAKDEHQSYTVNRLFDRLIPEEQTPQPPSTQTDNRPRKPSQKTPLAQDPLTQAEQAEPAEKQPINIWRWGIRFLVVITALLIAIALVMVNQEAQEHEQSSQTETPKAKTPQPTAIAEQTTEKQGLALVQYIDLWQTSTSTRAISPWPTLLPSLLIFLISSLGLLALLHQARQRTRQEVAKPPIILSHKRARFHIPALRSPNAYHLLSHTERQAINAGIDQLLSEQTVNKLDIPNSVQQSATKALPHLLFEQAQHEREVWLWQDQTANTPNLSRHANELCQHFKRANIYYRRGYFRGVPLTVHDQYGQIAWQHAVDPLPDYVLLLVLTDGIKLLDNLAQQTAHIHSKLNAFASPSIAFVNYSHTPSLLDKPLASLKLTSLQPPAVAAWLVQQQQGQTTTACDSHDLHRWAMACALQTRTLSEEEILALHHQLRLNCAWQYAQLSQYATRKGQGLDFQARRLELLQAFSQLPTSQQKAAIRFWLERNQSIDQQLQQNERQGGRNWQHTKKQQQWQLQQALLQLWHEPSKAIQSLYDLHEHPELQKDVEHALSQFRCQDLHLQDDYQAQRICLNWSWQDLTAEQQRQLRHCHFGGTPQHTPRLQIDQHSLIAISLLIGLALSGLAGSVYALWPKPAQMITQLNSPEPPQAQQLSQQHAQTRTLGTYKSATFSNIELKPNHQTVIQWQKQAVQLAQQPLSNGKGYIWYLGTNPKPKRPIGSADQAWPNLSYVMIETETPEADEMQALAAKWLDTGSADKVLLAKRGAWQATYKDWLKQTHMIPDVQWLFLGVGKTYRKPPKHHRYAYWPWRKRSAAKWGQYLAMDNGLHLAVGEHTKYQGKPLFKAETGKIKLPNGIKLIQLPRGQFEMGSNNGADDEQPVHTVNIDYDLWISQTEITFDQYDPAPSRNPHDRVWGRADRPVINVNWHDAKAYAEWLTKQYPEALAGLECRLPSEAEWEYAARAGTTTAYPWGDKASHEYANYGKDECCDGLVSGDDKWENTAPVGQFPVNPFGLYDMHGNVYEWVEDCWHEDYDKAPNDGRAWTSNCANERRVLRGGAWFYSPYNLRSANRDRLIPDFDSGFVGFRVLCSPPSVF